MVGFFRVSSKIMGKLANTRLFFHSYIQSAECLISTVKLDKRFNFAIISEISQNYLMVWKQTNHQIENGSNSSLNIHYKL